MTSGFVPFGGAVSPLPVAIYFCRALRPSRSISSRGCSAPASEFGCAFAGVLGAGTGAGGVARWGKFNRTVQITRREESYGYYVYVKGTALDEVKGCGANKPTDMGFVLEVVGEGSAR